MSAEINKNDEETNDNSATVESNEEIQAYELNKVKVDKILDEVKAGDSSLNKLKVQNLDFILDIPLKVTVELGRTKVLVKDLLQMGQGSVLELDKLSGEPLEILVNGKLVAKGEVVVINEKFGARLTDIISPIERIETLK